MKAIYTDEALEDLAAILAYLSAHYPAIYDAFQIRLQAVSARICRWPDSAQEVVGRPGVRVVPLIRYPYKIFYRRTDETIEILHIHHTAQDEPQT